MVEKAMQVHFLRINSRSTDIHFPTTGFALGTMGSVQCTSIAYPRTRRLTERGSLLKTGRL